ncbi:hypothetical protein HN51_021596 [Arachis hypogaea]|uniref:Alkyl transferase n=2 Tax=Arachis TaxID=3817 RepID=A0A445EFP5_ARAHY|nr:dehydrodolichyl diphosphate synthase CPT3-like [Arachis duranensis]XP_025628757.1 dehydrodolichyl diphosphate synthase 6-like [Arachis hypogaea]XP_057744807.1 dehydrodolichyl diphosphate synthase CPT3-like [Arachis stenosperma]RYR74340.1 hypothetical protein Ahy_A02g009015 [Arachis hypogaea]
MDFFMVNPRHFKISDIALINDGCEQTNGVFEKLIYLIKKCVLHALSIGPIPIHVAFIMDGNRRYAKKNNLVEGSGYKAGFFSLISMLNLCYELGVRYVTIFAFSIDNFKRCPEETRFLMDLMKEKIESLIMDENNESINIANRFGMRVHFVGDLKLLDKPLRLAAKRIMEATVNNSRVVLSICVAYNSTLEILHSLEECCEEKCDEIRVLDESGSGYGLIKIRRDYLKEYDDSMCLINLEDVERNMYMAIAPCPNILIRTSGENRLSNFLLWQSTFCYLYSPFVLWPDFGFWHFVWAILNYQRSCFYLDKKRKQL